MANRLRLLLLPFAWLYQLVIAIRNFLYDKGYFKSYHSKVPVISIGNLAVGGTGKSPVTELVCRIVGHNSRIAVLSRGYGRKTTGFIEVSAQSYAEEVGDEPLQLKKISPGLTVAVCEDREKGIRQLEPGHDLIVLDDAFQHRAVTAGLSILLFDYSTIVNRQFLLPAGNLREPFSSRKRADILMITKAPEHIQESERTKMIRLLGPFDHQQVFFSWLQYGKLVSIDKKVEMSLKEIRPDEEIVLLTGIANPAPLFNELKKYTARIEHIRFRDHHPFTQKNIVKLALIAGAKRVITTEKDAQRLLSPELKEILQGINIYYLQVRAVIREEDAEQFKKIITEYVSSKHSKHNRLY